ncbi:MAG TPA: GMC family oxidoreductase [Thermoleophilaceae bacterium]|nr:GMC family oxidoreductase [Thermoleophilaceae bacterium]
MSPERTDVCIVGTGFGGAITAYYLARAGRRVVMLERGRRYRDDELQVDIDPKKLLPLVHQFTGNGLTVLAGTGVGGGSLVYSGASLRAPSFVFDRENARGRIWPRELSRRALDPWYRRAEAALGTHQLSFREVAKRGGVWARHMNALGYRVDPIRQATTACLHCGFCNTGCRFGRKNHLPMNYLLGAERAGAEIRPKSEAVRIAPADGGYRVTYGPPDQTNLMSPKGPSATTEIQAEQVIVAGGAIGTAGLLLRSRPFLPGLSQQLGKNLSGNGDFALAALLPEDPALPGNGLARQHEGVAMDTVCYEFLESHGFIIITQHQLAPATLLNGDAHDRWWGRGKKDVMRDYGQRMVGLAIIGVDGSPGQVRTAVSSSDQYGLSPAFGISDIDFPVDRTTQKLYEDARRIVGGLLERMGGQLLDVAFNVSPTYGEMAYSAHPIGTARMADTPETGVVDAHGEVFGHPGLFVTDGAAVPTALGVNPSLTIAANAERMAAGLVRRLGKNLAPPPVANPHHRPRPGEGRLRKGRR